MIHSVKDHVSPKLLLNYNYVTTFSDFTILNIIFSCKQLKELGDMAKHKATKVGISIGTEWIELVLLANDLKTVQKSVKVPMPMATMDPTGDRLRDPQTLATSIAAMLAELNVKPPVKAIHVTVPGTLVRIVEMPKIPKNELLLALVSEAERYAVFNDTEALVDYEVISEEPDERQKIILVALRKDTVAGYKEAFDMAKVKISTLEVETISSLRGLKYSGKLEEILEEVNDQAWGTIHFEPERIRIAVWHYDQIKNWREVLLDTSDLRIMGEEAPVIQDLVEEVRRTIGMTRPAKWLTYGIPETLAASLTSRLGAPVQSMMPGSNINLDDPKLSLAAVGVSCKSYDKFPAFINIVPVADGEDSGELLPSFKIMMVVAVILAVLFVGITIVLKGITWWADSNYQTASQEVNKTSQELATLTTKKNELEQKVKVSNDLASRLNRIIKHNGSISKITDAVRDNIPSNVWLDKVTITSGNVDIEGQSIDYDSIYKFSKNFEDSDPNDPTIEKSPVQNIDMGEIKEEIDNKTKRKSYKFSLKGQPRL